MTASLLDPIALGAIAAPNRIVMAPLTRGRAGPGFVPNDLARDYYRQRASAGLIVSEATGISQEGLGWPSAPGLWTDRSEEHTSELQSLMRNSYAVFCFKKKKNN